jgi:hypothetical protein
MEKVDLEKQQDNTLNTVDYNEPITTMMTTSTSASIRIEKKQKREMKKAAK